VEEKEEEGSNEKGKEAGEGSSIGLLKAEGDQEDFLGGCGGCC
jgi:hypothetical protein